MYDFGKRFMYRSCANPVTITGFHSGVYFDVIVFVKKMKNKSTDLRFCPETLMVTGLAQSSFGKVVC